MQKQVKAKTPTQKIHDRIAVINQYLPNTFSLQYNNGKIDVYANVFDEKAQMIVKHREHTFIEGTKREINIFLDGVDVPYIIASNHNKRTDEAQKTVVKEDKQ